MKYILFIIIVFLLTPVYIVIQIFKKLVEYFSEILDPLITVINIFCENMFEFWAKKFFKEGDFNKK